MEFSIVNLIINLDCALRSTVYLRIISSSISMIDWYLDYFIFLVININLFVSGWKIMSFLRTLSNHKQDILSYTSIGLLISMKYGILVKAISKGKPKPEKKFNKFKRVNI